MNENAAVQVEDMHDDEKESSLSPAQIVSELDKYIIGQRDAKKAVAIAMRNRWRRIQVEEPMRQEITPKNIIMIGPTGVGKTEISRRLAKLSKAPFVKVEASKFTEVGYVGRDVESIIRDLAETSFSLVKDEEQKRVEAEAKDLVEERLLDLLLPESAENASDEEDVLVMYQDESGRAHPDKKVNRTREKLRSLLRAGKMEDREVEFEVTKQVSTQMQILGPQGMGEIEGQIKEMFSSMVPRQKETKTLPVSEARKVLEEEAKEDLIDHDRLSEMALQRAEESGIVFIDEIDKVCAKDQGKGPDVSREGVQRDLLPLVEGSTVPTKYGNLHTEHVLFIASGAFHISSPSDLMPEFQGRFPIRVELRDLSADDFKRILLEPHNALTRQYEALLQTEGVEIEFTDDAIDEIASITAEVNSRTENIGARRLHTVLEKLLEEVSFDADKKSGTKVCVDRSFVQKQLGDIVEDLDLTRYIL